MDIGVIVFSGILAISGPSGEPVPGSDRAQIRCRPAPYYVADRGERVKPQRTILTGTRVPVRAYQERRATRPCHLMHAPSPPTPVTGFVRVSTN